MKQLTNILQEIIATSVKLIPGKTYTYIGKDNGKSYELIYKGSKNNPIIGEKVNYFETKNGLGIEWYDQSIEQIKKEGRLFPSSQQQSFKLRDGKEYNIFKNNTWKTYLYHKSYSTSHPHTFVDKDDIRQGFELSDKELESLITNKDIKSVKLQEIQVIGSKITPSQVFELIAYVRPIHLRVELIKKYLDPLGYLEEKMGLGSFIKTLKPHVLNKLYRDLQNEIR